MKLLAPVNTYQQHTVAAAARSFINTASASENLPTLNIGDCEIFVILGYFHSTDITVTEQ